MLSSPSSHLDREGIIRLIMRFRGRKEYRHIDSFCERGLERLQEILQAVEKTELPLIIDFGSSNTTTEICMPDGSRKIAACQDRHVIPSVIGITGTDKEEPGYVF